MKKAAIFIGLFGAALIAFARNKPDFERLDIQVIVDQVNAEFFGAVNTVSDAVYSTTAEAFGTPYDSTIAEAAEKYEVPPRILFRLLKRESAFAPDVISGVRRSSAGALGIAQFMPATAVEQLGSAEAALDPSVAIPGAARYLRKLYDRFGNWTLALAAYNWGQGNLGRKGFDAAPRETVDYVAYITEGRDYG